MRRGGVARRGFAARHARGLWAAGALLLGGAWGGCTGGRRGGAGASNAPSPPAAVARRDGGARVARGAAPPSDAGPVRAPDARAEFLPDVLARCWREGPNGESSAADAGAGPEIAPEGWRTDVFAPDQREVGLFVEDEPSGSDGGPRQLTLPTRLATVRAPGGRTYLVTVGFAISGVEEYDCSRVLWFDWDARQRLHRGPIARDDGTAVAGAAYWLHLPGPYAGAALLVVTDAEDRPRGVRFFDGPTVLGPDAVELFARGRSFVVYTVNDGMNFESPTDASLVYLGADGLVETLGVLAGISTQGSCHTVGVGAEPPEDDLAALARAPRCRVPPAGGLRVLARGAAPRVAVIEHTPAPEGDGEGEATEAWYRRTEPYRRRVYRFVPAERRFVPEGDAQTVRLRPTIQRLPARPLASP